MSAKRTYVFQCAEDRELFLVWQPGVSKVFTFRASEKEFQLVMDKLREDDPTVELIAPVAA